MPLAGSGRYFNTNAGFPFNCAITNPNRLLNAPSVISEIAVTLFCPASFEDVPQRKIRSSFEEESKTMKASP